MKTRKSVISITIALLAMVVSFTPVVADQYGQYGSGSTPSDLTVNKKVRTPIEPFSFVENLNEGDLKYSPDTDVTFSIEVKNSGDQTFEEVKVEDILPDQITSADTSDDFKDSYNSSDRRLTFYLKDLKAGETKTVEVTAHLAKTGYPDNTSVVCKENKVEVRSEDRFDDDTARFCIQFNVLGTTTLPQAGLEDYLPLMPFLGLGLAGMLLLKKRAV